MISSPSCLVRKDCMRFYSSAWRGVLITPVIVIPGMSAAENRAPHRKQWALTAPLKPLAFRQPSPQGGGELNSKRFRILYFTHWEMLSIQEIAKCVFALILKCRQTNGFQLFP